MTALLLAALALQDPVEGFLDAYAAAADDLQRGAAFDLLAGVRDPRIEVALAPLLTRAGDPIRLRAAEALGAQLDDERAARALLAAAATQSSAEVTAAMLLAFGRTDVESEARGLVPFLRGKDEETAVVAAEAAGAARAGALVMPLMVRAAELDEGRLRTACLAALRETTGQELDTPQRFLVWWRANRDDFVDPP